LVGDFDAELDRLRERVNELPEDDKRALKTLAANSNEDCSVCLDFMQDPVINRLCLHFFCKVCAHRWIARNPHCPMCRGDMQNNHMLELPLNFTNDDEKAKEDDKDTSSENDDGIHRKSTSRRAASEAAGPFKSSSKIDALVQFIQASHHRDPAIKSIVYSQWTSMLDKVQAAFARSGVTYERLDGTMNRRQRDDAINSFQSEDGGPIVLLASLRVASLGLNLTRASQVFFLDPWWNPFVEDQATDRVYRLGQTRTVTVIRLVMEGTIEEKVVEIQSKKREFFKITFGTDGEKQADRIKQARAEDIRELFGI
jgi:SWI/SNF-related matrix-associated actin-dependent regulator of chromatin subfamily A3